MYSPTMTQCSVRDTELDLDWIGTPRSSFTGAVIDMLFYWIYALDFQTWLLDEHTWFKLCNPPKAF